MEQKIIDEIRERGEAALSEPWSISQTASKVWLELLDDLANKNAEVKRLTFELEKY